MQMPALVPVLRVCAMVAAMFIAAAGGASAQFLSGSELLAALKQGGYVIDGDGKPVPANAQGKGDEKEKDEEEKPKEKKPFPPAKWTPSLDEFKEIDWWRTVAFRKLKRNESLDFEYVPRHGGLPEDAILIIKAGLSTAKTEDDIKAAFVLDIDAADIETPAYTREQSDIKALADSLNRIADGMFTKQVEV